MSQTDETRIDPAAKAGAEAKTPKETAPFLQEMAELLPDHVAGQEAITAVMCILNLRLSPGQITLVTRALPGPVRVLVSPCPRHHKDQPEPQMDREGFMNRVAAHLRETKPDADSRDAEQVTRTVFAVMRRWLPEPEVRQVARQLPFDLREIWLASDAPTRPENSIVQAVLADVRRNATLPAGKTEHDAVFAVLCTLYQRLSREGSRDVVAELSGLMQEWVKPCALHRGETGRSFERDEFVSRVASHLDTTAAQAEPIAITVFAAAQKVISVREIRDVARQLPRSMQELWAAGTLLAGTAGAAHLAFVVP